MDDTSEIDLKKICSTCLSTDRKLYQLCRLKGGVNNLYSLLSYDSEAYKQGFFRNAASFYICWECRAVMHRLSRFRQQACTAQRLLSSICDGHIKSQECLSHLTKTHTKEYNLKIAENEDTLDNFIDCGLDIEVKIESDEEIPLSEIHNNTIDKEIKKEKKLKEDSNFFHMKMSENELNDLRTSLKLAPKFVDSKFKCDSCLVCFDCEGDLDIHKSTFHVEKSNHTQCDVCLCYIKTPSHKQHRDEHYTKYACRLCEYACYGLSDVVTHMQTVHGGDVPVIGRKKKSQKNRNLVKSRSKVRSKVEVTNKKTPYGYICGHCNKKFDNHHKRWKHIQQSHAEGHACPTCGKRFAFKTNLVRHERIHRPSPPRTECPTCHKQVRTDHMKNHSLIHTDREQFNCIECNKTFVSRASYEHHLKYTQAHTDSDLLKYKCSLCDKGYRSRGELQDHVNYQHMSKTNHKCPICDKALATKRCITRHVRRAHDGHKERKRDKICQLCGKAFMDKKSLREHELIHTGERPLSCELCGCTFRQSASLYTHKRRVHKIRPPAKDIQLLTDQDVTTDKVT